MRFGLFFQHRDQLLHILKHIGKILFLNGYSLTGIDKTI